MFILTQSACYVYSAMNVIRYIKNMCILTECVLHLFSYEMLSVTLRYVYSDRVRVTSISAMNVIRYIKICVF